MSGSERNVPYAGLADGRSPEEALATLVRVVDKLDAQAGIALRRLLPRADSTVGLGLGLFLAAGGIRALIGPIADELDEIDPDGLLDAIEAWLESRVRLDADGTPWLIRRIPLQTGDGQAGSMLWAVELGRSDDAGLITPLAAPRFVIQVRLARLGPVQLTGRMRGRHLEITVQTAAKLPAFLIRRFREEYAAILTQQDLNGHLSVEPLVGTWLNLDGELRADCFV